MPTDLTHTVIIAWTVQAMALLSIGWWLGWVTDRQGYGRTPAGRVAFAYSDIAICVLQMRPFCRHTDKLIAEFDVYFKASKAKP